jgi:hypothetical protein
MESRNVIKERLQAKLEQDKAAFFAAGGTVTYCKNSTFTDQELKYVDRTHKDNRILKKIER